MRKIRKMVAYAAIVDFNPVRAGIADTPETSEHNSIQYRINALKAGKTPKKLMPFAGNPRTNMPFGLPFILEDYLQFVDITGRHVAKGKKGVINVELPDILNRINLSLNLKNSVKNYCGRLLLDS